MGDCNDLYEPYVDSWIENEAGEVYCLRCVKNANDPHLRICPPSAIACFKKQFPNKVFRQFRNSCCDEGDPRCWPPRPGAAGNNDSNGDGYDDYGGCIRCGDIPTPIPNRNQGLMEDCKKFPKGAERKACQQRNQQANRPRTTSDIYNEIVRQALQLDIFRQAVTTNDENQNQALTQLTGTVSAGTKSTADILGKVLLIGGIGLILFAFLRR